MLWERESSNQNNNDDNLSTTSIKHQDTSSTGILLGVMDESGTFHSSPSMNTQLDRYHADLQSMVDSYANSVDSLSPMKSSPIIKHRRFAPLKIA